MTSPFIDINSGIPVRRVETTILTVGGFSSKVQMQSLDIKLGIDPNTCSFFIPFTDNLILNPNSIINPNNPIENITRIRFTGPTGEFCDHYMAIASFGITVRGDRRGIIFNCKDYLRGFFLKHKPINVRYNHINYEDIFKPEVFENKFGVYYTGEGGSLIFEPINQNEDNPYALIDAKRAITDIFYRPKRVFNLGGDYPELIFSDIEVEEILSDFKISEKSFTPSNQLNAIMEILKEIGSKYDIYAFGNGFELSDHKLIITKHGRGLHHIGEQSQNQSFNFDQFVEQNHQYFGYYDQSPVVITRDEATVDDSERVDGIFYRGAPREYFVKNAPLIPAWDWWNDYNIIVRKTSNNEVIPYRLEDGTINPKYPLWLGPFIQNFEDLSKTYGRLDQDDENSRLEALNVISILWGGVLQFFVNEKKYSEEKIDYYINLNAFDALFVNPDDPIHQFRFKRYVAIPPAEDGFLLPIVTPETGWDHKDLRRFRNVKNVLIDGKRVDVEDVYFSNLLTKLDTYKLSVPPLVEGLKPDYYEKSPNPNIGITELNLKWTQIQGFSIDQTEGFFIINDPQQNSVYFDKTKIRSLLEQNQPFNFTNASLWTTVTEAIEQILPAGFLGIVDTLFNTVPGSSGTAHSQKKRPFYEILTMFPGGPTGVVLEGKYIPFRTKLRATFYYSKDLSHSYNEGFDIIDDFPGVNETYLAGIYPEGISQIPETRLANLVDENMKLQTHEGTISSSGIDPDPEIMYLQDGIVTRHTDFETGRISVNVKWKHRNDANRLEFKAKRLYDEKKSPRITGTLQVVDLLYAGSANNVIEKPGLIGIGLGFIEHRGEEMPITHISHRFDGGLAATIGFELQISKINDPFEPEKPISIRAREDFRNLKSKDDKETTERQAKQHGKSIPDEPKSRDPLERNNSELGTKDIYYNINQKDQANAVCEVPDTGFSFSFKQYVNSVPADRGPMKQILDQYLEFRGIELTDNVEEPATNGEDEVELE